MNFFSFKNVHHSNFFFSLFFPFFFSSLSFHRLFVIGLLFVAEAFLMLMYAKWSRDNLTDHDRTLHANVLQHLNKSKKHKTCHSLKSRTFRFCYCKCPCGCMKTRNYDAAVHKLYRVFFKHFYRVRIEKNLHKRSAKFDFAR